MTDTINSDTVVDDNPFKVIKPNSGEFYARAARVKWATGLGRNSIELRTLNHKDTRHIITHQGDPLYNAMVAVDPYLPDYPDFKDRNLLPVWKICLDHQNHVVSFEAMPLDHDEQIRADVQRVFDELHALGRKHGVAWGTVDNIARDYQRLYTEDWPDKAKENITAYAASVQSKKLLESIAFHKNQFDYWWRGDTNVYPFDTRTVSDLEAWFGPKEKSVSDTPAVKTLGEYLNTQAKWGSFWTNAKNLCNGNGIAEADQEDHIHEALLGPNWEGHSAKEFPGTLNEAYAKIKASFDTSTKHTEPPTESAAKEVTNETEAGSGAVEPEKPQTPIAAEKPHMAVGKPDADGVIEADQAVAPEPPKSMAIVPVQNQLATLPMVAQWDIMRQQAQVLIKSGFLPQSIKTAEQCIAIMMMGQALKIEPIVALSMINVVSGKPTVSPQLMMALVRKSGQLEFFKVSDDGECCTVTMKRRNEPEHVATFSMSDASAMQLAGKDNWRKQPAVMRQWRAIAAACRVVFPDVCWGIAAYTPEEIDPDIVIEAEVA